MVLLPAADRGLDALLEVGLLFLRHMLQRVKATVFIWSWSSPGFVDSYGLTDSSRSRSLLS